MIFLRIKEAVRSLTDTIVSHPYNRELFLGTLDKQSFHFYLEQDFLYLYRYAKVLNGVAQRFAREMPDKPYQHQLREFAVATFDAQRDLQATYLEKPHPAGFFSSSIPQSELIDSMSVYLEHLETSSREHPLPIVLASLLPCFWIYSETGKSLIGTANLTDNHFQGWIELQYCSPEFDRFTETYIETLNALAQHEGEQMHTAMIQTFKTSLEHELNVWNEVYFRKRITADAVVGFTSSI